MRNMKNKRGKLITVLFVAAMSVSLFTGCNDIIANIEITITEKERDFKMKEKTLKCVKENWLFIAIILLGTLFLLIPAFHENIWFDESYSVAIVNHSFGEIWTIGSHDVHPILYYWMLKVINLIFGESIIAYRIFSVMGIVVLGTLGLTHIKKDFGKTTGLLFTFFSFFLPVMLNYALEIRMYSWTIVFVTLMAIYLYRFIKDKR